jgi:DNA-binding MarR family transcriptional regulator
MRHHIPGYDGPMTSEPTTTVEADLGWALGVVFRSYLRAANHVVDDLPGGPRGYQVLAAADRENARNQLALAQQLGVDRTVMTYLLDDLEGAGLVERRPDPADRRARQIVLTGPGRERLCALERDLRAAEDHVLEPLDEADRTVLRQLLQRLATRSGADVGACQVVQEISETDPHIDAVRRR